MVDRMVGPRILVEENWKRAKRNIKEFFSYPDAVLALKTLKDAGWRAEVRDKEVTLTESGDKEWVSRRLKFQSLPGIDDKRILYASIDWIDPAVSELMTARLGIGPVVDVVLLVPSRQGIKIGSRDHLGVSSNLTVNVFNGDVEISRKGSTAKSPATVQ